MLTGWGCQRVGGGWVGNSHICLPGVKVKFYKFRSLHHWNLHVCKDLRIAILRMAHSGFVEMRHTSTACASQELLIWDPENPLESWRSRGPQLKDYISGKPWHEIGAQLVGKGSCKKVTSSEWVRVRENQENLYYMTWEILNGFQSKKSWQ